MSQANDALLFAAEKGYYVDMNGNAYSPSGKKLSLKLSGGRYSFGMRYEGIVVRVKIHKFIAYFKFGDKMFEDKIEIRHLDNDSLNNNWDNIEIGTHSENMMDITSKVRVEKAIHAGKKVRVFSDEEVKSINIDRNNGFTYKDLEEKYGSPKSTWSYFFNYAYYNGERKIPK
jgi:hypothetical protein